MFSRYSTVSVGVSLLLVASLTIKRKWLILLTCRLAHLSVCMPVGRSIGLSARKVYYGKTAEWIRMPFGMVSVVRREMGVLDGWWSSKGKGQFWEWIWGVQR